MPQPKHKAPTEVSIAATEEQTFFHLIVEKYWKMAAGLAALIAVMIVGNQLMADSSKAADDAQWAGFNKATFVNPQEAIADGRELLDYLSWLAVPESAEIDGVLQDVAGSSAEAWALLGKVHSQVADRDYESAMVTVALLAQHTEVKALNHDEYTFGGDASMTLVGHLSTRIQKQRDWENENAHLFSNPAAPEGSPRVKIITSAGDIVVAMHPDEAPIHVANFLTHVRAGDYNGTKFHSVSEGQNITGGCPNTRESDFSLWGKGGDAADNLELLENKLYHFAGAFSAAKAAVGFRKSSSIMFSVTTKDALYLDGSETVFGTVLSGMDIVAQIESGEIEDPATNRPADPIQILSMEVIE